jgi:parallel beta-helix repeat protein
VRGSNPATTIIDGGGLGTVVTLVGPLNPQGNDRTGISGFTIRNGSSPLGGGVLIQQGKPVVARNIITGNSAPQLGGFGGFGGGVAVYRTRATVTNNLIINNGAGFKGGGIDVYRSPMAVISNNTVVDNQSSGDAGGIALSNTGSITLGNNIVTGNTASGGGGIDNYSSNTAVINSDVWNNSPNNYAGMADPTGSDGNLSVDPMFINPALPDLRLQEMSSVVDAGTEQNAPNDDFDGQARPLDGDADGTAKYDMGAYELRPFTDSDGDGLDDLLDNCPAIENIGQENGDLDRHGDACDNCVDLANDGQQDLDSDGIGDLCDNCISLPNVSQLDTDGDNWGDPCDPAPADASIPANAVPTLGEVGLAVMMLLMMGAMLVVWRRRQGVPVRGRLR